MPKFLKQEDGSLEPSHRRNAGGSWAGASWTFVPFMGAQHAKVPRTWGWLLGAITQKGRRGKPGGSQGDGPSPLERARPAGPFTGVALRDYHTKVYKGEWGVSHG